MGFRNGCCLLVHHTGFLEGTFSVGRYWKLQRHAEYIGDVLLEVHAVLAFPRSEEPVSTYQMAKVRERVCERPQVDTRRGW